MPTKMTLEEFVRRANVIHNFFYDYSLAIYVNNHTKVCIICPRHGEFWQRPGLHLTGQTCFTCSLDKKPACQKKTNEEFINDVVNVHGDKYDYSEVRYTGSDKKIKIICRVHGVFYQQASIHLKGHGCPECGNFVRSQSRLLKTEEFIKASNDKHGNRYDYSETEYVSNRIPVKIICSKHGAFYQTPNSHLMGSGCSRCVKIISNVETRWLDAVGIPNDPQHRNVRIKRKKGFFKVDGLDPQTNTVYEFYGDLWHGNPKIYNGDDFCAATKKTFGEMFSKTVEKEKELISMGYKVISIWENDYRRIYEKR